MRHTRTHVVGWLICAGVLVGSCAPTRPTIDAWVPVWRSVAAVVPEQDATDPSVEDCEAVVVSLRSQRETLFPTPDAALDETVQQWVDAAESAFFECPPRSEDMNGFDAAYAVLQRLEEEIAVVVRIDESG